jgi:hypothetical protein
LPWFGITRENHYSLEITDHLPEGGWCKYFLFFTSTLGIEKKNNFTGKLLVGDQVISDQAEKQELVSESMKISLAHLMTERSRLIYLASIIRIMIHPI